MQVKDEYRVDMSAAEDNFAQIAKAVDENGAVTLMDGDLPRYVIMPYIEFETTKG